ncbi:hypothetical protein ABK040_007599 [Willaertia magna]
MLRSTCKHIIANTTTNCNKKVWLGKPSSLLIKKNLLLSSFLTNTTTTTNNNKKFYNIVSHNQIPGLQISSSENYSEKLRSVSLNPIVMVPQGEIWVVERFGKFKKQLQPGINFILPFLDQVAYKHSTKEISLEVNKQTAITKDNVQLNIDGILYVRITEPYKASYEIERPFIAIMNLAQTTMRSEIGKITLDTTFAERQHLNERIVQGLGKIAENWGFSIQRYEIRDIQVPIQIKQAMDLEAEAERKKRKTVLDSLAQKESQENVARGKKTAVELVSEANMIEEMNVAKGHAFAIKQKAVAYAEAIERLAEAVSKPNGDKALAYKVAEQYIEQFGRLAQVGNTVIVPTNVNDVSAQVTQAVTIFDKIYNKTNNSTISKDEALERLKEMVGLDKLAQQQSTPLINSTEDNKQQ